MINPMIALEQLHTAVESLRQAQSAFHSFNAKTPIAENPDEARYEIGLRGDAADGISTALNRIGVLIDHAHNSAPES